MSTSKPRAPRKSSKADATDATIKSETPKAGPVASDAPFDEGATETTAIPGQLVTLDARDQALVAFKPQFDLLAEFKKKFTDVVAITYDMTTTAGDKAARADRLMLVTARTSIDKRRKALNEADQDRITTRNTVAKELTLAMSPYETAVDNIITADEECKRAAKEAADKAKAEAEAKVSNLINEIRNVLVEMTGKSSAELDAAREKVRAEEISTEVFGNRYGEAVSAKDYVMRKLAEMYEATKSLEEREAMAAQAEAIRKRQAEEQAERDEQARLAEVDRVAQVARENDERAARLQREEEELAERRRKLDEEEAEARRRRMALEEEARAERQRVEDEARELKMKREIEIDEIRAFRGRALNAKTAADARLIVDELQLVEVGEWFGELLGAAVEAKKEAMAYTQAVWADKQAGEEHAERQRIADAEAKAKREKEEAEAAEAKRIADAEEAARREREAQVLAEQQALVKRLSENSQAMFNALQAVSIDPMFASLSDATRESVTSVLSAI